MTKRLKIISGDDLGDFLSRQGFARKSQNGSHVKYQRVMASGEKQTLHFPLHKTIVPGTLRAFIRQAGQYISYADLELFFYSGDK